MQLTKITDQLLFLENDPDGLLQASRDYYDFLSQLTGVNIDPKNTADKLATILPSGKAIAPQEAAICVLDYVRTSGFMRGLHAALLAAKKRFPDERIEILYAGCGPFAALALPLCTRFSADELCFTLLDFHIRSVESVEKLFQTLGFSDHLAEIIQTDATVYEPTDGRKFHIIITETMQKTLEKEPQVAITQNLKKHLRKNGIFIPEKITIEACLADVSREFSLNPDVDLKKKRIDLGQIFELSAATDNFAPVTVEIPEGDFSAFRLLLLTRIKIFESFSLDDYNSGITYPSILSNLSPVKNKDRIEFCYQTGEDPHFEYRLI